MDVSSRAACVERRTHEHQTNANTDRTYFFPRDSQSTYDKLLAEVPKYKMITVSILCDRLRITCSLARKGIAILLAKGLIKPLVMHSKQHIYTTAAANEEEA